jgi:poly-gamma-glutamate capsule biosynthesis protein CapA/YwtB (metallophosphatase superfamily)
MVLPGTTMTIAAVGDALITRPLSLYDEPAYQTLLQHIRAADASFVNLEVVLSDYEGTPGAEPGGIHASASSSMADELQWAGFNLFSVANNHALDYGIDGLLLTLKALRQRGIAYAGCGHNLAEACAPGYVETSAGRVGLVACSSTLAPSHCAGEQRADMQGRPGVNPLRYKTTYRLPAPQLAYLQQINEALGLLETPQSLEETPAEIRFLGQHFLVGEEAEILTEPVVPDLARLVKAVREARRQAHVVLVSIHAHERDERDSLGERPAAFLQLAARAAVEAGADAVLGHGPHLLRGIEIYHEVPIFYSLGNFIFQNEGFQRLPADAYERFNIPSTDTPSDLYDQRTGFAKLQACWESVLAVWHYNNGQLSALYLYPFMLGFGCHRLQRGRPLLASGQEAGRILAHLQELSTPYGTEILVRDGVGMIELKVRGS